jgi:hypothetical protein
VVAGGVVHTRPMHLSLLLWWVVGFGLYLALIPAVTLAEAVVGLVLALGVACAAMVASRAFGAPPCPPRATLRRIGWLPVDVVRDAFVLVGFLVRSVFSRGRATGRFGHVRLRPLDGHEGKPERAYDVLLLSVSPSCYVLDVDVREESTDVVRLHRLGRPSRFERAVAE